MDLSIIIPCYNHGLYIHEAIESVSYLQDIEYEIIIVNDGSTDISTIKELNELKEKGFNVLSHENKGLGYSRNAAIKTAKGKYILPLDSDNKIKPEYIYKALQVLNSDKADIVYANPTFFGENNEERQFKVLPFDGIQLFRNNYIDACAIYKKEVWKKIGGYDEKMPFQGFEDWEFWLHAHISGYRFHYINEELYFYRIVSNSMISATIKSDKNQMTYKYIINKHLSSFINSFQKTHSHSKMYQNDLKNPLRASFKYLYHFLNSLKKSIHHKSG